MTIIFLSADRRPQNRLKGLAQNLLCFTKAKNVERE
jgi:hypothetical protein